MGIASDHATLSALRSIAAAAADSDDLGAFLEYALECISNTLPEERFSLLLVEDGLLRASAAIGLSPAFAAAVDGLPVGPHIATCGRAAATGDVVVTHDVFSDPNWEAFLETAGAERIRSCWSVPFCGAGELTIGTLAAYSSEPGSPSTPALEGATALAAVVGLGIETVRRRAPHEFTTRSTILALTSALDARDRYTGQHSTATSALAMSVGRRLGLDPDALELLEQVALLHDVGKLAIPNEILHCPTTLDTEQWAVMRTHPEVGEQILRGVPGFEAVARAVRHEHERWDGRGYPDGIAGEQIPIASRIVFACDAFHAMTSDRPYRASIGRPAALTELRGGAGTQFDPTVVDALLGELGEQPEPVSARPLEAEARARTVALEGIARGIGADDLLVFRRTADGAFSHSGGVGRGEVWAGTIELTASDTETFRRVLACGGADYLTGRSPRRIVGPYYARSAVIAPVGDDAVIVLGSSSESLADACSGEALKLAHRAAAILHSVSPAKRLADELEVLETVRTITTVPSDDVEETLKSIADRIARALSCSFGALVVLDPLRPRVGWASHGWRPGGSDDLSDRLISLVQAQRGAGLLIQDTDETLALLAPLGDVSGAAAVHLVAVGPRGEAWLLLVHAEAAMRGFTSLCARVAHAACEAADAVVRRALAREALAIENAALAQRVRTDALTGLANAVAWEELFDAEELHRARSGKAVSMALFDIHTLDSINAEHGRHHGDDLLRAAAGLIGAHARATDVVARLGGARFGVLLRYCEAADAEAWCERVLGPDEDGGAPTASVRATLSSVCLEVAAGATLAETFADLRALAEGGALSTNLL